VDAVAVIDELKIEYVPVDEVMLHPDNPNNGDMEAISESIRVNGLYQPIIVQKSTGLILAGNHRYMALAAQGNAEVPVIYVDVDDQAAKKIMLADNRTARLGQDDPGLLAAMLEEITATDEGNTALLGTGYSEQEAHDIIAVALNPDALDLSSTLDDEPDDVPDSVRHRQNYEIDVLEHDDRGRPTVLSIFKGDGKHITKGDYNAIRTALGMGPASPEQLDEIGGYQ
jgi:hypothetical protein